ncbi:MAG: hypothetical protein H7A23_12530 [Leptospiraceae bacterium]|nr:hypothetical protein [Leptospiraceae bacterium]MCP5495375.1 hypothetical protein [Leptospiraceae bacterium]
MTYFKFISKAFQRSITYRLEYYVGLVNAFLYIFIFTSVWKTVARDSPGALGGWSEGKLIQYAVLSTLIKVSFGRNENLIQNKIKSGDIIYDVLKPYSFVVMALSDSIGISLFQLFGRAIPLLIFSMLFFGFVPDVTWLTALKFLPVYLMAFVIYIAIGSLISSLAFFFTEIFSFMILYFALVALMSGSILPLTFFPDFLVDIIAWTPFPYLFFYPTSVLLDTPSNLSYNELLFRYMIHCGTTLILSFTVYFSGIKKLEIAGG